MLVDECLALSLVLYHNHLLYAEAHIGQWQGVIGIGHECLESDVYQ
jgi:hypothetical protein